MKIGKQVCCELPKSRHTEGRLNVFGKPCPDVAQPMPTSAEPINAHKKAAGHAMPEKLPNFG